MRAAGQRIDRRIAKDRRGLAQDRGTAPSRRDWPSACARCRSGCRWSPARRCRRRSASCAARGCADVWRSSISRDPQRVALGRDVAHHAGRHHVVRRRHHARPWCAPGRSSGRARRPDRAATGRAPAAARRARGRTTRECRSARTPPAYRRAAADRSCRRSTCWPDDFIVTSTASCGPRSAGLSLALTGITIFLSPVSKVRPVGADRLEMRAAHHHRDLVACRGEARGEIAADRRPPR